MNKKAAIVTAGGLGDGLIMLVAAKYLKENGFFEVTIFNNHLSSLKSFLPYYETSIYPQDENEYLKYDFVLLQNDNSEISKNLFFLRHKSNLNLCIFYPGYKFSKHGKLENNDFSFDPNISMVENVDISCRKLFNYSINKNNKKNKKNKNDIGIIIPKNLKHKKYKKRVVIHPTSGDVKKNWPKKKYIKLANKLEKEGFEPHFILREKEKDYIAEKNVNKTIFSFVSELAAFIYESSFFIGNDSGPGHLASYFSIPSIIIANDKKRMLLWQPGWKKANIITPPTFIPNIKGLRFRENKWDFFISSNKVLKTFFKI